VLVFELGTVSHFLGSFRCASTPPFPHLPHRVLAASGQAGRGDLLLPSAMKTALIHPDAASGRNASQVQDGLWQTLKILTLQSSITCTSDCSDGEGVFFRQRTSARPQNLGIITHNSMYIILYPPSYLQVSYLLCASIAIQFAFPSCTWRSVKGTYRTSV
jgi:hypothetical protein